MGGCTSKPKVLKDETDASLTIDDLKKKVVDNREKEGGEIVKEEASNRQKECKKSGNQSLDFLLKEMEAKEADQPKRKQIVEEFETKMTTIIEEESTTDLKDMSPIAKEESKDSIVDT